MVMLFGGQKSDFILLKQLDFAEDASLLVIELGELSGLLFKLAYAHCSLPIYPLDLIVVLFSYHLNYKYFFFPGLAPLILY